MSLCVNSSAKASDNSHLDSRHGTDDAPRIQLVFVGHKDSLRERCAAAFALGVSPWEKRRSRKGDRTFGFCRQDTRPNRRLPFICERGFTILLLVGGKGDDLYKTLSKGKQLKPTNYSVGWLGSCLLLYRAT